MFLGARISGFGTPEIITIAAFVLVVACPLIVLTFLLFRVNGNSKRLKTQLDENQRLSDQAIQMVGSQVNERVDGQTKALNEQLAAQARALSEQLAAQARAQNEQLASQTAQVSSELKGNREEMSKEFAQVRQTMEGRLTDIQAENTKKLEEMRATVDDKLSETLERRFSESFTLISERLESVQRGLGEMQLLAGNVVDLKNILANVKTRGNFGEYQLQALLEDVFTPDQYEANFAPNPRSQQRVEFAVRLPGYDEPVYMPIDSKFPIEDYQRLLDAYEQGDKTAITAQHKELVSKALRFARDIRDKYLNPPRTTDFGIMFVPTEGLYAELTREPGFIDGLRGLKVLLAGPTTLQALIASFQVGFSTLAIEKRSSEVEQLLGAVKTEFDKFQGLLDKVDKRLEQARADISQATRKTGTIRRKLKGVTELPAAESSLLLADGGLDDDAEVLLVEDIYDGTPDENGTVEEGDATAEGGQDAAEAADDDASEGEGA